MIPSSPNLATWLFQRISLKEKLKKPDVDRAVFVACAVFKNWHKSIMDDQHKS
jgi:hypothetical protein